MLPLSGLASAFLVLGNFPLQVFFSIMTIFKMLSLALDWTLPYLLSVYLVFLKCSAYLDASWYLISLSLSLLDGFSSFTFFAGWVSLISFFIRSVRLYTIFYLKCYILHFQDFRSFSSVFLLVEFMFHIFPLLYFIHLLRSCSGAFFFAFFQHIYNHLSYLCKISSNSLLLNDIAIGVVIFGGVMLSWFFIFLCYCIGIYTW